MTNSSSANEATVMDYVKRYLPYAAVAWVLLLLITVLILLFLPSLTPLACWILLGLVSVLITGFFYMLTFPIQKSFSFFQTTPGKVTLQLVGPVVLLFGLLYFGRDYIPTERLIELSGMVTDSDGRPVEGVTVLGMRSFSVGNTGEDGKFHLSVPRADNKKYDIVAFDNNTNTSLNSNRHIDNPLKVNIENFPSVNTIITARNLKDQSGKPIDNVQIYLRADVKPQGGTYRAPEGKGSLAVTVGQNEYWYIVKNEDGNVICRDKFRISPGRPLDLPETCSLQE